MTCWCRPPRKKKPRREGRGSGKRILSSDFNIYAWTAFSFSVFELHAGLAVTALLNDGLVARVTADSRVGFPHTVGPARWSDAGFIADLGCARRRANHCRTCEGGCKSQRIGCPHPGLQSVSSLVMQRRPGGCVPGFRGVSIKHFEEPILTGAGSSPFSLAA
jgi:hypothetical protein